MSTTFLGHFKPLDRPQDNAPPHPLLARWGLECVAYETEPGRTPEGAGWARAYCLSYAFRLMVNEALAA